MFRRLLGYVRPYRAWATAALIAMLVVAASNGALVALSRPLFDDVLSGTTGDTSESVEAPAAEEMSLVETHLLRRDLPRGERGAVINALDAVILPLADWWNGLGENRWRWVLGLILGVFATRAAAMFFSDYAFKRVGLSAVRDIRNELYESIINQSNSFFVSRPTGELVSRILSDVETIQTAVSERLGELFQESANLLVLIAYVLYVNTELSFFSFIVAPLIIFPIVQFARRLKKATQITQERMANVATLLEETIRGVRIVKAFAMENFEVGRFRETTDRHLDISLRARMIQAASSPVMELLAGVCIVLLVGYAAVRIRSGVMTIGEFISFIMALSLMYQPIKKLNKVNLMMNAALAAAERVFQITDHVNEIQDTEGAVELTGIGSGIVYRDVSFRYGDGPPVLSNFNLEIAPGEMVALVGASGAGKSTVANLLPRFYDVSEGSITIDGVDVRDATLTSLRGLIGMVTQEVVLFNDTVRNNIAYGHTEIDLDRVRHSAEAANAAEFIDQLSEGYDSWIGESGVTLSGGQRQRLAIARAIMKDAPVFILDEATSALDSESERLVQSALENLTRGRTTLVIAHRLSTIRRADKIVVLEKGNVVEQGSHDELLARDGAYARLYSMQFHFEPMENE